MREDRGAERPAEDEVLQAAKLSAGTAEAGAKRRRGSGAALLVLLLTAWSFGVHRFFTRETPPLPAEPTSPGGGGAGSTPIPGSESVPPAVPEPAPVSKVTAMPETRMLRVTSEPPGASVMYQNTFVGRTPLELTDPEIDGDLRFRLAGYAAKEHRIAASALGGELKVTLEPLMAKVRLEVRPENSRLLLDGAEIRLPPGGVLELPLRSHELTVQAPGHQSKTIQFTPAEAYERKIPVTLLPLAEAAPTPVSASESLSSEPVLKTAQGLEMLLPEFPLEVVMGSPRGTAGRQSNEVQVNVKLTRPFRISRAEISNAQFRKFNPEHDSGRWKGIDLNADALPVCNLRWEDAVAYCNWLSKQEGLPPAYVQNGERWEFEENPGTGYRLPTEAEWEALARHETGKSLFGWGDALPPPANSVNLAGKESAKLFASVLENYSDRFAGPAPAAQAGEGPFKLLGLFGNVSEWVQDAYAIPALNSDILENPANRASGKFHVIKGASWQDAGFVNLRISRRRYGDQPAADLGFRVARYLRAP